MKKKISTIELLRDKLVYSIKEENNDKEKNDKEKLINIENNSQKKDIENEQNKNTINIR